MHDITRRSDNPQFKVNLSTGIYQAFIICDMCYNGSFRRRRKLRGSENVLVYANCSEGTLCILAKTLS